MTQTVHSPSAAGVPSDLAGLPGQILAALRPLLVAERRYGLHEPRFAGNEAAYLQDCLASTFVSSVGPYVDRFERELAAAQGVPYAVAVVNGTAALHICLLLSGVRPGDEVIIPALTFVATANAVSYCGAVPHLADISPLTLGLDPLALDSWLQETACREADGTCRNRQTGRRIAAMVPMHCFGHMVGMEALLEVAARWNIAVVEDAAEALGSRLNGRPAGSFAPLSAVSFNGNKIITTGGGGAILTADPELAKAAKHLTTTAKLPHRWAFSHDRVGYNYRMPNINAALGVAQLEQLPGFLARKRALTERYAALLQDVAGVSLFRAPPGSDSNYWLQAIMLDPCYAAQRDAVLDALHEAGILARPAWGLMGDQPMYAACPSMPLPVSRDTEARLINLPSTAALGDL